MRPASARSRRLPPRKPTSSALSDTRLELHARWPAGAVAARVHRCSKTSTRPSTLAFAGAFRPRALPRLLQIDVSTSTASDHSSIPGHRFAWPGRLPWVDRSSPFDRAAAEGTQGQGPKVTEPSALPPGIAPARDFAPTPIASDTSCRGHRPSPAWSRRRDERSRQRRAR
jgi:hypothetical protein